jgi:hypothetical protein
LFLVVPISTSRFSWRLLNIYLPHQLQRMVIAGLHAVEPVPLRVGTSFQVVIDDVSLTLKFSDHVG